MASVAMVLVMKRVVNAAQVNVSLSPTTLLIQSVLMENLASSGLVENPWETSVMQTLIVALVIAVIPFVAKAAVHGLASNATLVGVVLVCLMAHRTVALVTNASTEFASGIYYLLVRLV